MSVDFTWKPPQGVPTGRADQSYAWKPPSDAFPAATLAKSMIRPKSVEKLFERNHCFDLRANRDFIHGSRDFPVISLSI